MEINRNSLPFQILVPKPKNLTLDHQIQKKKIPPIQPNLKLTSLFFPFPTNIRLPKCGKPYPATRVTVPGATVVVALSVAAARPLNPGLPDLGGGGGGGGNFYHFSKGSSFFTTTNLKRYVGDSKGCSYSEFQTSTLW